MKRMLKKAVSVLLCLATLITAAPFSDLFESAQAATADYNDPLIARVAEYCSPITSDALISKLNSGVWDLNNVDDYNEYVSMYNELQESNKERGDLLWLTNNEVFTAWQFKEHISQTHIRAALGLSALVFNGEAIGYITGEWAEKEKYKAALEKYMEANCDEVLETTFIDETVNILQDLSEEVSDPLRKAHIKELKKNVGNAVTSEHVKTLLYEFHFEGDKYLVDVADVKNNQLADAFGIAGEVIDLVDVTANGVYNLVNVSSNLKVYELYGDFLDEIANDYNLPVALRCAANELSQSLAEQYLQAVAEISADFMQFAADKCISLAAEQFGSVAVSTALQSVLLGISIGKIIGNVILGVDELIKSSAYVECYAILAEKYQSMVLQDKERFIGTPNRANAEKFRNDYNTLQKLRLIGEQTYIDMQGGKGTKAANKAIRSMTGYEDKKAFCDDNIEKTNSCAFSMSSDSTATKLLPYRTTYSETVVVACPVDVNVYDSDDNLVAKVTDNVIDGTVTDTSEYPVIVYVDDDVKTIRMTDSDKYRIEIEAFDSGEMTYSAYTYGEDYELVNMAEYAPVKIISGDEFEVNPQTVEDASYQKLYTSSYEELKPEKTYQKENLPETKDDIADVIVAEELFEGFSTELIDKVANAMFKFEPVVDITSYNISTDDTVALFSAISKYYPTEYSLLTKGDFKYKIIFSPSLECITDIRFYYGDDANLEAFEQRNKDLKAEIDKIVAQVEGMDDFEKALYIHDYIVLNSEYDLELLKILKTEGTLTGELRSEKYTEYSILINGTGICGSYALAYRALMNAAGVDCLYLSSQQMNHAWNMVKIDGEWYHVDCCWDDPVPDTYGDARRTYFLRTDEEIMELNHYSWVPGTYQATSNLYSDMPRNYNSKQKYDSGYWYISNYSGINKKDPYSKDEEVVATINSSVIDIDNGDIYFASSNIIYCFDVDKQSKTPSLILPSNYFIVNFDITDDEFHYYAFEYDCDYNKKFINETVESKRKYYESVTGIALNETELEINIFESKTLTALFLPENNYGEEPLIWSTSNKNIVSVSEEGVIYGNNLGTATITVSFENFCASCEVTVNGDGLSGMCGDNVSWTFDAEEKTMYLTGSGPMTSYTTSTNPPWYSFKDLIKHLKVGEGVETISSWSFGLASNLQTVSFSSTVTEIGSSAFNSCVSLDDLVIPGNIKTLNQSCFGSCYSLSNITIQNGVEVIQDNVFSGSKYLQYVYLPESLTTLKTGTLAPFEDCVNLKLIDVDPNNKYLYNDGGILYDKLNSRLIKCCPKAIMPETYYIDDGIQCIYQSAFKDCENITNIVVPNTVTVLYSYSFSGCKNLKTILLSTALTEIKTQSFYGCESLTSVNIPSGVTKIGSYAFSGCRSIEYIFIPEAVTSIGESSFTDCDNLKMIEVDENNLYYKNNEYALFDKEETNLIKVFPNCNATSVYVPDTIININLGAFDGCKNLTYIYIPALADIVLKSGGNAVIERGFANDATNLKEIEVSNENTKFKSINGVLYNKGGTKLIKYPSNKADKIFTVPDTVTNIAAYSFMSSRNLSTIYFNDNVNAIGSFAFKNCDKLRTVSVPYRVRLVNLSAFSDCDSLESLIINSSLQYDNWLMNSMNYGVTYLNFNCDKTLIKGSASFQPTYLESTYSSTFYCERISQIPEQCNWINTSEIKSDHKHDYVLNDYVEPTESYDGYEYWECYCGEDGYKISLHNYGESIIQHSTCTEDGYKYAQCKNCKEISFLERIPALGHNYKVVSSTPGNCTAAPTETFKCSICQDTYTEIGSTDTYHSYTETVIAPTCTEIGYTTAVCEHCGENAMYDFVPMLGHNVTVTHTDADCKKCARTEYSCSRCDYHEIIVDEESGLGEHKISVTVTEATCTENGSIDRICVTCNELFSTDVVASNGHIPGEWETATDATTESAGKKEKRCIVCKELVEEEEIPKIPVNVTGILLSESEIEISNKGTHLLTATVSPENADDRTVTWGSDDPSVATVDENGLVTAVSIGETTVSVTTTDGGYTASCAVTVIPREFDITWVSGGNKTVETYKEGSLLKKPSDPVRTGYTFTGWTPEVPDIMPAEDLTFTATWTANTYDAVFDANGGKWADGAVEKTVPTAFDSRIAAPEAPVKQGYIFSKWSSEVGVMDSVDGKKFVAEWIAATDTRYTVETYTMNTSGEYVKTTKAFNGTTGESVSVNPTVQTGFTLNKTKSVLSGNVAADNSLVLKVYIDRNTYTLTTVADGVSTSTKYLYGSLIAEPATPVKTGYKFIKWDKTLPETMPANDVTLTAVFDTAYTCPDCGDEIVGESAITEHIAAETRAKSTVSIKNNPGTKTIKYGETLRLTAIASKPDDVVICWYVDGAKKGEGTTFDLTFESGTKTVEVKLEDADGNTVCNPSGAEISDSEEVTVNAGFFQKIISFFKNLFRMDRTVIQ